MHFMIRITYFYFLNTFNEKLQLPQNMEHLFNNIRHLNVGYNYSVIFQQRLTTFISVEYISACNLTNDDSTTECS